MVGYQATKQTIIGVGGTYQYSSWKFYDNFGNSFRQSYNTIGYRAFVMQNLPILQDLIGGGYLQAEIEKYESLSPSFSYRPSFLVGAGLGNPRGFNLTVLYDFNYKNGINPTNGNPYSLYGSPLVLRVGGFFFWWSQIDLIILILFDFAEPRKTVTIRYQQYFYFRADDIS